MNRRFTKVSRRATDDFAARGGSTRHGLSGLPFSIDWLPDGRAVLTSSTGVVVAESYARRLRGGEVLDRVDADRGCFACMLGGDDGRTLYVIATEWNGIQGVGGRTGQVLTHRAPAPHAGRP